MKSILPLAAIGLLLTAPSACRLAQAQSVDDSASSASAMAGPTIDLDVVNASLLTVVQALKLQSHAQIVVVNSKSYQPVTLTVTASLNDALQYVAQSAGAVVTRDANGVYTFRAADDANPGALGALTGGYQPAAVQPALYAPAAPAPQEAMHSERIALQFVDPNYVLIMLNDPSGFRNTDPSANPINNSRLAEPFTPPRITSGTSSVSEENPYAATNTGQAQLPGVPLANGNYSGAANQANRVSVDLGNQANQFVPGQFGGPNQILNPGGATVNPYAPSGGLQNQAGLFPSGNGPNTGQNNTNSLRPQGIDSITANEEDNSLIVRGTPEGITELKQIVGFIDRAPRQVQIKVEFVTTNVASVDQFGINWSIIPFPNVAAGFNGGVTTTAVTAGQSYLTYAQGNVAAALLSTLTDNHTKVVDAPIITTTNNVPGTINFSSEIPYTTTNTVAQGSGNTINSSSVQFLDIPNSLTITPRINGDDSVSLYLNPQLTTVTSSTSPPATSTQAVQTYRTVANGETMVIGGLVSKTVTNARTGIPFLSQLPIIGSLFRTRDQTVADSELLIFVTPTVLPPIGSGLATTPTENGEQTSGDSSAGVGVTP